VKWRFRFILGLLGTEQQLQCLNDFFGHLRVNHLEVIQGCNLAVNSKTETFGNKPKQRQIRGGALNNLNKQRNTKS